MPEVPLVATRTFPDIGELIIPEYRARISSSEVHPAAET
jgi:hypothetical protein